jgi:hypothetical protein
MCDAVNATGNAHATKPAATNTGHVHRPAFAGVTTARMNATKNNTSAAQSQKAVMPAGYGRPGHPAMLRAGCRSNGRAVADSTPATARRV